MNCKKRIEFKKPKICTSDLNKRIAIEHSASSGSSNVDTNADTDFVEIGKFWAAIKTSATGQFFDEVNLSEAVTTDFFIRYTTKINLLKPIWVKFCNRRFKIVGVENMNEDKWIIRLRSIERGSSLIEATKT